MTITAVRTASVYVTDSAQAVEFYTKTLGFSVKARHRLADGEGIELVPPGGNTGILLLPRTDSGSSPPRADLVLRCSDTLRASQDLKAKGVKFSQDPVQTEWGYIVARFEDLDGNGLGLTNQPF